MTSFIKQLKLIKKRQTQLKKYINKTLTIFEESCLPSYIHPNQAAALTAWWRLHKASTLLIKSKKVKVLDFGASSGEIYHFINHPIQYDYIEQNPTLKPILIKEIPNATEKTLNLLPNQYYDTIIALDSLEHNKNVEEILSKLLKSLKFNGQLILSGPTENLIYRMGRKIAGFSGDYHMTTINEIEMVVSKYLKLQKKFMGPLFVPLFSITSWTK